MKSYDPPGALLAKRAKHRPEPEHRLPPAGGSPGLAAHTTPTAPGPDMAPEAAHSRGLMDRAQTGLYVVQDGVIAYANPMVGTMLGHAPQALQGLPHTQIIGPEFRAHAELALQRRLQGKPGRPGELQCLRHDGSTLEVRVLARRIEFQGRVAVLVTLLDISELKHALRCAEWNASMLARTESLCRAGSFEVAWPSGQVQMSAGLAALLQWPAGASPTCPLHALSWIPEDENSYVAGIWRHAVVDEPFEFQHRVLRADGQRLVVLHRGLLGADGRGVALLQDITAQVEAAQRIQDLATHHEVTGLPNRGWLLDQLDAAMHAARWEQRVFALLAIDVPRIAEVKANMGFGAGDTLCMALAARLRQDGGSADVEVLAQLGDTEFAVILEAPAALAPDAEPGAEPGARSGTASGSASSPQREALRNRALALQRRLQMPVRLGATDVYAQCVIGIALFPGDGDMGGADGASSPGSTGDAATPAGADRLLECAQAARLDVAGGAGVAFFRPESNTRALRAMQIESALWQALERQEFELHYQPQVDLASGAISGAEALLRWHSPELGPVAPGEFIPVAERSGLIGAIGDWVMRRACQQLGAWKAAGLRPVRVAVNLASSQLQQPDLALQVQALLVATGVDPHWLGIELTESMVMADVEGAASVLSALKAIGIQISLDDFGTGFSSLSYLSRLPIDVVKVDRSFVRDVTADAQDVSVTRAIIHMTHGLQMRALAEGVETEGQLSLLVAAGCDEFQGYWFSKAVPADAFEALVRADRRLPERYVQRGGGPRRRTLLLVDDEANVLAALQRLLRHDGYRILTAPSAEQGLQCLAQNDVDVIVSDQRMPGMTGVEFLRRAKVLYPQTLRLVLSGYTELQSIIDAVNEGAIYKLLTKPWDDERLREHIAEAFRQKGLADENRALAQQVAQANADLAAMNERLGRTLDQQRQQAELLAASAGSMREVFDDLPVAVLGLECDGTLAFINHEAERLLPALGGLLAEPGAPWMPPDLVAALARSGRGRTVLQGQAFQVCSRPLAAHDASDAGAPGGQLLVLWPLDEGARA